MNILHISNTDVEGGRFNGYSMQGAIDKIHNVKMAVWKKESKNSFVRLMPPKNSTLKLAVETINMFGRRVGMDELLGLSGWYLPSREYFKKADVVHLHLIHNNANFSLLSIPWISHLKPVIWTIHDLWAMTGGCEHSFDCIRWLTGCIPRCPYPRRRSLFRYTNPYMQWKIKCRIYQNVDIEIIVASQWMKDRVEKSPLLRHFPCEKIPFGIDLEIFKPRSKIECRKKFGIAAGHKVIAFRDVGLKTDRFKGLHWLMAALKIYQPHEPTCLLIFEDGKGFKILSPKYQIVTPGWIDGEALATALSAADVFMMPSIQEAFGLMAVEAMACGTPVIVFEGTSLPGLIRSPEGGLAVPSKDSIALAGAIELLLIDDELRSDMGRKARHIAESEYSLPLYIQRHISIYEKVIERQQQRNRLKKG